MRNSRKLLCTIMALCMLCAPLESFASPKQTSQEEQENVLQEQATPIYADLANAVITGDATVAKDVIKIDGSAKVEFSFESDKAFESEIYVEYRLTDKSIRTVETGFSLGEARYEVGKLALSRVYKDDEWKSLDKKPSQIQLTEKLTNPLRLTDQRAGEVLTFSIKEGKNAGQIIFTEQKIEIYAIKAVALEATTKYEIPDNLRFSDAEEVIEAEKALYKSDSSLSPTYDLTSSVTSPYSYDDVYLNTIGASTWNTPGQWISWEVDIDEAGYYGISMRVRQNTSRGLNSYRRISIDDSVIYDEFAAYGFGYERSWYIETLKNNDDETIYIWLDRGRHTLKMEAVMGDSLTSFELVNDVVTELNSIYTEIIMLTGSTPDANRSYQLFKKIPELPKRFKELAQKLKDELERIETNNDSVGTSLSFIDQFYTQLMNLSEDQDLVVTSLSSFKSNISTLATLLTSLSTMPLEVDQIVFSQKKDSDLKEDMNFFERIWFEIKRFLLSFSNDHTSLAEDGESSEESLKVWCMLGRDQAQILNDMVGDSFKQEYGIDVEVSVITAGLSEAIMAGRGPDVVVGIDRTMAVNLGVRDALADLSQMENYEEIISRFQKTAMNGYTYKGETYALPNTQEYKMMFIRTDIYEELGLEVCDTWDELLKQLPVLGQYNMSAGIPSTVVTTMLLQNGLHYYNEDLTETVFSTDETYDVYKKFVSLYTDYETPVSYNASNRFRSGEMPVIIDSFSFYNTLAVLAPELQGLWNMYLIPGTLQEDGTIDRSAEAAGTASAIIADSQKKTEAMQFLDWWTSDEIQSRFGIEIENILGRSGRYATANVNAFSTLNWSTEQMQKLQEQRKWVNEIPATPVSYIIDRNMNNIFIMTVNNGYNIKETLLKYSRHMDDEMTRKYAELASYK